MNSGTHLCIVVRSALRSAFSENLKVLVFSSMGEFNRRSYSSVGNSKKFKHLKLKSKAYIHFPQGHNRTSDCMFCFYAFFLPQMFVRDAVLCTNCESAIACVR